MLELKNLCISYGDNIILKKANFIASEGVTCVIGKSGSGKSSLLNAINEQIDYSCNKFSIDNVNLNDLTHDVRKKFIRHNIAYLVQGENFISDMSCFDNIKLFSQMAGKEIEDKEIRFILEKVGLNIDMLVFPDQLSGGERQRLAIAQALAKDTRVILCDEITASLDEVLKKEIMQLLIRISHEMNKIIIITSHDEDLFGICDSLYQIKDNEISNVFMKANGINETSMLNRTNDDSQLPKKTFRRYISMKVDRQFFMHIIYCIICATVVATCTFLSYYFYSFVSIQKDTLEVLSPVEISVINQTVPNLFSDYYSYNYVESNKPFDNSFAQQLENVEHIETYYPYYVGKVYEKVLDDEKSHFINLVSTSSSQIINYSSRDNIWILPYYEEQNFSKVQKPVNNVSQSQGAYINYSFIIHTLGLTEEDVLNNDYTLNMVITLPVGFSIIEGSAGFADDDTIIDVTYYEPCYESVEISIPIIGVIDDWYVEENASSNIYLPFKYMDSLRQEVRENIVLEKGYIEWSPNSYKVFVDDSINIEEVSLKIKSLDENITTGSFYTNNKAKFEQQSFIKWVSLIALATVLGTGVILAYAFGIYYHQKNQSDIQYFKRNGLSHAEFKQLLFVDVLYQSIIVMILGICISAVIFYIGMLKTMYRLFKIISIETICIFFAIVIFTLIQTAISRLYYYKKVK